MDFCTSQCADEREKEMSDEWEGLKGDYNGSFFYIHFLQLKDYLCIKSKTSLHTPFML